MNMVGVLSCFDELSMTEINPFALSLSKGAPARGLFAPARPQARQDAPLSHGGATPVIV